MPKISKGLSSKLLCCLPIGVHPGCADPILQELLQVILSKCTHILSMHNSDIPNQGTMPRRRYPLKYGHCAFGVAYIALQTLTSTALVQTPYGSYYLQQA